MGQIDFSDQNVENLLNLASAKLGMDKDALRQKLQTTEENDKLAGGNAQLLSKVMSNPKLAQQMLQSPSVQNMLRNFLEGKEK